jgi:hypothetical protein
MGTDIEIPPINEHALGPAMLALTDLQRRYVRAIQLIGDGNHTRACAIAGYAGGPNSWKKMGYDNAHHPKIAAAMIEEGITTFQTASAQAAATVLELSVNPGPNPKVAALRLKAALAILDRAGIAAQFNMNINQKVTVESNTVMLTKLEQILATNPEFINAVPRPIQLLLEQKHKQKEVVDVEFSEVDPDAALFGET